MKSSANMWHPMEGGAEVCGKQVGYVWSCVRLHVSIHVWNDDIAYVKQDPKNARTYQWRLINENSCCTYLRNCLEHTISPRDIACSMLDVIVLDGDEELCVAGFGLVRCWLDLFFADPHDCDIVHCVNRHVMIHCSCGVCASVRVASIRVRGSVACCGAPSKTHDKQRHSQNYDF